MAERIPTTPLVGRARELELLLEHTGITDAEARDVVLLGGDAGIGKTRLLRELSVRAQASGHRVLTGHCLDLDDIALPYQPFAEALGLLPPAELGELADRFPALAPLLPGRPAAADDRVERADLFASVVAALDALAAERPLLLVVEDAHWAEASTRHLIRYVLAHGFAESVHVVISYRADDLHRRHPLRQSLGEWVRLPGVRRLELAPLADAAVATLVAHRGGDRLPVDALRAVVVRAGGNAFFVEELLDAGVGAHDDTLPESLSDLVLLRLERLDDPTRRLVRAAAVTDGHEGFVALAAAADLSEGELDAALASAVDHKVLRRNGAEDYGFRHALLAEALRDDLLPGERRRIHATFLAALDVDAPAATVARHALAAGERRTAFLASCRAAESAGRVAGYDEAAQHYEQALALLDEAPEGTDAVELVVAAADALVTSGRPARALELLRDGLRTARTEADVDARGRYLVAIGNTAYFANVDAEAWDASEEALEVVPDGPTSLRAQAAALRARTFANRRDDESSAAWAARAVEIAESLGDLAVLADAKATLTRLMVRSGQPAAEAQATFRTLVEDSRRSGHVLAELRGLHQLAFAHYNVGELDAAEAAFTEGMRRAEETGWSWGPYGFDGRYFGALVAYLRGRWDDTLRLCEAGPGAPATFVGYLASLALLVAAGRGDEGAVERTRVHRPSWRHDDASSVHSATALVELHGLAGDLTRARRTYDDLVELQERAWGQPLFAGRVRLAAVLVGQYAAAARSRDRAEQAALVEHATELAATVEAVVADQPAFGPEGEAWRLRAHAEVARLRWLTGLGAVGEVGAGRAGGEPLTQQWRAAHAAFRTLGDPYETARCATRLAAVLRAAGQEHEARALLTAARDTATALDARPLLEEIRALEPRADPPPDLTPRELEVLHQVALGLSNGEIGTRLFISTKTVSVHVSNILAKLGAGTRTEAAAIARRAGLVDDEVR